MLIDFFLFCVGLEQFDELAEFNRTNQAEGF